MSRVGFVGFGRMGRALAAGAVSPGVLKASDVVACESHDRPKITIEAVVRSCRIVFLCVKPQSMEIVLNEIVERVPSSRLKKVCFVSIAAGLPLKYFENKLGRYVSVLRVMPNTPSLLKAGMSGVSRGKYASAAQEKSVVRLLKGVGEVVSVPEKWMDAVTAVSGSGPAYIFYVAEAMIDAAITLKMPATIARQLVHQTIYGAGRMLEQRPEAASELRRQVTSPKGTTAAAIEELDASGLKQIFQRAIQKAARRAAELAKT